MSATTRPCGISRLTFDRALVAPYHLETPLTTRPRFALIGRLFVLQRAALADFARTRLLTVDENFQRLQHLRRHIAAAEIFLQILDRDTGVVRRLLSRAGGVSGREGGVRGAEGI